MEDDFVAAYDAFMGTRACDEAWDDLYTIVRTAFLAGWKAAGGEMPQPVRIIPLPLSGAEKEF